MNFKDKLLSHKKMIIGSIVALLFGTYISYSDIVPTEEYNKLITQKTAVTNEIATTEQSILTKNKELVTVTGEKDKVEKELAIIQKEKKEIELAKKAEEERLVKKAEEERLAKEAEERKGQEQLAQAQGNAPSSNSTASSSSGTTSDGSAPAADTTTPVTKMVWVTKTGKKYHSHGNCGNSKYVSQVSLSTAQGRGLGACGTCY